MMVNGNRRQSIVFHRTNPILLIITIWIAGMLPTVCGDRDAPPLDMLTRDYFRAVVDLVKSGTREYPALIVNGMTVVTDAAAQKAEDLSFCFRLDKEDKCIPTVGKMKVDTKSDVGYLKVFMRQSYSRQLQFMVFSEDLSKAKNCVSVSLNHESIWVKATDNEVVDCDGCQHMDALICDFRYVGILVKGKRILHFKDMLEFAEKEFGDDTNEQVWVEREKIQEQDRQPRSNLETTKSASGSTNLYFNVEVVVSALWLVMVYKL